MENRYRRSLLGTVGTSLALGAGCLSDGDEEDESSPEETDPGPESDGSETESDDGRTEEPNDSPDDSSESSDDPLEYLPASVASEQVGVVVTRPQPVLESSVDDADDVPYASVEEFGIDPTSIDTEFSVIDELSGSSPNVPLAVLTGDIALEGDGSRREYEGDEFTLYDQQGSVAAVYDDLVIVADSVGTVTDALDAGRGEAPRLLERVSTLEEGLETVDHEHLTLVAVDPKIEFPSYDVERDDVRFLAYGMTFPDEETGEMTMAIGFADEDVISDELVQQLEESFYVQDTSFHDEPTATVEDAVVKITFVKSTDGGDDSGEYERLGGLRLREFEPDDEFVQIELRQGDPTPVENVELELEGEPYDRDVWAGDAERLAAGDTIRIRRADLEPNTTVTLRIETESGTRSSSSTLLEHVPFEFARDRETGDVSIAYPGSLSLTGDDLVVAVYERPLDRESLDPERTIHPWAGEDVTQGDTATVEDVEPGTVVAVGWKGTSTRDILDVHFTTPPGTASFERDSDENRVSVTLEFPYHAYESRPADEYRIRVDQEPAETQWTDRGETVESGDTVTLEGVDPDANVDVVYVGWEQTALVASTGE